MAPTAGRLATRVAAGVLLTRILGFVRERVFAHYFGNSPAADAFRAALKIPNVIRNLLGEGTLSASFIPVYAGLIERGETEAARVLAGVIASLLVFVTAVAAVAGVLLAPIITDFAAPGFSGPTRDLTVTLVAIMFPMSGLTILSAWCLGVLNTHRRFFLSYAAPAVWNIAQIATLVWFGAYLAGERLAVALAWGALAGSALQLVLQLPQTMRLVGRFHWGLQLGTPGVRTVIAGWVPVVFGAGVAQISSIVDTQLGSLLGTGAVATLGYAQLIAILPVSLFGVSVAAAALPELSRDAAGAGTEVLRRRVEEGARRVAFFVVPSAVAFAILGRPIVGLLFQTGQFTADDTRLVAGVLLAYAVGLPAQASVKLLASAFYAFGDTRSPVKVAAASMVLSAVLAYFLMQRFGAAGIALGASCAACVNVALLFRSLRGRLGPEFGTATLGPLGKAIVASALSGLVAFGVDRLLPTQAPWLVAVAGLSAFGLVYGGSAAALGHPDAMALLRRFAPNR
jgi:putative peptidoglycan lipid II flippase